MLEYFAYKKYKKTKAEKDGKVDGKEDKTDGKTAKPEAAASPSPSGPAEAVATPPPAPATATPLLDDDDERFLEQLTSSSSHDENHEDDEGPKPALPPRVKTPDLTWDSDSESFVRDVSTADAKGKKPNRFSLLLQRAKSTRLKSKDTSLAPPKDTKLAVPTPEADRETDDLTRVLDDLNLAARNNKAFSLSAESTELVRKFTLILKDLVNGVPTAVNDLTALLEDPDNTLAKNYEKLPKSLKKLVTQLPEKLSSTLAPELLAVAAEAQGLTSADAAAKGGVKGAAKRLLVPKNLKELVTKPGAIVSMLKGIMNALKVRWPAFMGTNVIWSLAIFLLLFVLWYCHKRGREVRLEKEEKDRTEGESSVVDGRERIEELPDDPALPAPAPARSGATASVTSPPVVIEPARR
ncbi:hypothetical protein QBC47DRAFT_323199 [Echria macrotheca]|uniref:Ring-like domain-containing protein n=1 Tax=Echria macrotheca TaxID=438768 RepID=A0AAJ0BF70_9PEZI|nr:hypothetical protein QBC47DRAFT_323199 [Echria macrotheca]